MRDGLRPTVRAARVVIAMAVLAAGCQPREVTPPAVLPGLAGALGEVDRLVIEQAGERLELERAGAQWREVKEGWRADRRWLGPVLSGLAEARCDEPRTADPAKFARIGVEWPPQRDDSESTAFARPTARLGIPVAGVMQHVVIGFARARGGTYVRVEGAASSCLTVQALRVPARVAEWRDPRLWPEVPGAPMRVSIEDADTAMPVVLVSVEGSYRREGDAVSLSSSPEALVAALRELRIRDSRPAGGDSPSEGRVIRFETAGGERFGLALRRDGADTWVRVLEAPAAQGDDRAGRDYLLAPEGADALWLMREE